jgi:Cu(I)/Ag(I) efflux system membrane fusion protein
MVFTINPFIMKRIVLLFALTTGILYLSSCSGRPTENTAPVEQQHSNNSDYYTCTMHPEVHSDKPGDCPKCGMKLVLAHQQATDSTGMETGEEDKPMN